MGQWFFPFLYICWSSIGLLLHSQDGQGASLASETPSVSNEGPDNLPYSSDKTNCTAARTSAQGNLHFGEPPFWIGCSQSSIKSLPVCRPDGEQVSRTMEWTGMAMPVVPAVRKGDCKFLSDLRSFMGNRAGFLLSVVYDLDTATPMEGGARTPQGTFIAQKTHRPEQGQRQRQAQSQDRVQQVAEQEHRRRRLGSKYRGDTSTACSATHWDAEARQSPRATAGGEEVDRAATETCRCHAAATASTGTSWCPHRTGLATSWQASPQTRRGQNRGIERTAQNTLRDGSLPLGVGRLHNGAPHHVAKADGRARKEDGGVLRGGAELGGSVERCHAGTSDGHSGVRRQAHGGTSYGHLRGASGRCPGGGARASSQTTATEASHGSAGYADSHYAGSSQEIGCDIGHRTSRQLQDPKTQAAAHNSPVAGGPSYGRRAHSWWKAFLISPCLSLLGTHGQSAPAPILGGTVEHFSLTPPWHPIQHEWDYLAPWQASLVAVNLHFELSLPPSCEHVHTYF